MVTKVRSIKLKGYKLYLVLLCYTLETLGQHLLEKQQELRVLQAQQLTKEKELESAKQYTLQLKQDLATAQERLTFEKNESTRATECKKVLQLL